MAPLRRAVAVEHGGGVDFEPAFVHAGQFEVVSSAPCAPCWTRWTRSASSGEAKGFENGLAAHVRAQAEERWRDWLTSWMRPRAVEHENAFDHAVEERLLLRLIWQPSLCEASRLRSSLLRSRRNACRESVARVAGRYRGAT